jgi:transposase InsO family protein
MTGEALPAVALERDCELRPVSERDLRLCTAAAHDPASRLGRRRFTRHFIDVARRRVLAWRLSNTLTADVYVGTLEEALKKFGPRRFLTRNSPVRSGPRH